MAKSEVLILLRCRDGSRVVMNLYEAAAYETYADGNSLFVVVGDQSKNEKKSAPEKQMPCRCK